MSNNCICNEINNEVIWVFDEKVNVGAGGFSLDGCMHEELNGKQVILDVGVADIMGNYLLSKRISLSYCPFCGRKFGCC